MNLLTRLLDLHTTGPVKERILDEIFAATVAGFGREAPAIAGLTLDERLAAYARFTRVERVAIADGRATGVWARQGHRRRFYLADLIVLAAGALCTAILDRLGVAPEETFLGTVNAGHPGGSGAWTRGMKSPLNRVCPMSATLDSSPGGW